ncbi:MAG: carboxypeptidase-like regulatory domain-containing protein, partial [Gemmatimonadota bacterium]
MPNRHLGCDVGIPPPSSKGGFVAMRSVMAVLLVLGLGGSQAALAQPTREITGKVTQTGGAPIAEASVSVLGQQVGARSNATGEYRLRV